MNTQSKALHESQVGSPAVAPAMAATQPLLWSIYREFWENRSIYLAPLGVAGVFLFGFLISLPRLPKQVRALSALDPARYREAIAMPYNIAAGALMLTGIIVSIFYCLDALHGERRDRSILFWKSLPVSDVTTVLAKASIPLILLPSVIFAVTFALHWIMLLMSSAVLLGSGLSVATFWAQLGFFQMSYQLLYHLLTAHALWPFPVYCWLLLVSGWARRAALLWAVLPLVAIAAVESIAFRTAHFAALVGSRLIGNTPSIAYKPESMFPTGPMIHITPDKFLSSPGLWIGLLVGAAFLAAAVQIRRNRGPI